METIKKLMEEIQTGENDFFDEFDKFVCTQEVFDSIRKLPNFKPADPTVSESGYLYGKPIYVHPACPPNTLMGLKTPKDPYKPDYMYPIAFQPNPKTPTGFHESIHCESKDYKKIRARNKLDMSTCVKVFAGLSFAAIVCISLLVYLVI